MIAMATNKFQSAHHPPPPQFRGSSSYCSDCVSCWI